MISYRKLFLLTAGLVVFNWLNGQQIPSKPVSYPIFSPLILNPAIAGSQDFTSINLISKVNGSHGAQMAGYNSRLMKPGQSSANFSFTNVGVGGYLFHDRLPDFRDIGAGISAAYHVPLGMDKFSGLSFGLSAKGLYHIADNNESIGETTASFIPNADLGMYYYGKRGFVGFSSVNLLSLISDTLFATDYSMPSEHLFFGGAKFVLSRKNEVIIEPSVLVSMNDSLFSDPLSSVVPYLKFYMQNAIFGTYFKNLDNLTFFLQYQFPRFYAGMCIEYPINEMLITRDLVNIELSFGLNLGKNRQSATALKIPPPLFGADKTQELPAETEEKLVEVQEELTEVQEDLTNIKEKEADIKEEQVDVKEELTVVKEELTVVKEELTDIKEELTDVKEESAESKDVEQVSELEIKAQPEEKEDKMEKEKDGVIFRVQITSSTKPTGSKLVVIDGRSHKPFEYYYVGAYRQCVGNFRNLDEAIAFKNRCRAAGYNQAFVAAFINNERVTDPAVFKR